MDKTLRDETNPDVFNCLKRSPVVDKRLKVDTYPAVPKPETVDKRLGEDKKPAVFNCLWRSPVVETKLNVETYPEEPSPSTVDRREPPMAIPATVETIVDANSVGSMKLLMKV